MKLVVHAYVGRRELIWAAAYMLHHKKVTGIYLTKVDLLRFLREQISQFGTDTYTLMGENWESDFANEIIKATEWVDRKFPNEQPDTFSDHKGPFAYGVDGERDGTE